MEETAEQVTSEHRAVLTLTDDGQLGGSVRRLELERPVWTVPVVVLDVDPKDLFKMAAPNEQQPIQALGADGADPPFCARWWSLAAVPGPVRGGAASNGSRSLRRARGAVGARL
jgi:hypothetical protein